MNDEARSGRPLMLLIGAVFLGPLMLAAIMYYGGFLSADRSHTNNGELLLPIVNVVDELADSPIQKVSDNQWLILYVDEGDCDTACLAALHAQRQIRLMLGKEMDRVGRVFLHGDTLADTVTSDDQHAGLITINDNSLGALLERKRPGDLAPGGLFLLDPLGNLVMYFPPELDPKDTVGDIKHLLKLSKIG